MRAGNVGNLSAPNAERRTRRMCVCVCVCGFIAAMLSLPQTPTRVSVQLMECGRAGPMGVGEMGASNSTTIDGICMLTPCVIGVGWVLLCVCGSI